MVQKDGRRNDDSLCIRMDITAELPARIVEEVERLSIRQFDTCFFDEETGCLRASVETTLYEKGA